MRNWRKAIAIVSMGMLLVPGVFTGGQRVYANGATTVEVNTVAPRSVQVTSLANDVNKQYTSLLNDKNYGKAIAQVSEANWNKGKRWYDGLKDVEVVARCIYSENTLSTRNNDRIGVAVVIANRVSNTSSYKSVTSAGAVVKQKSQFSGINPGAYKYLSSTNQARAAKSNTDAVWKQATKLACILMFTSKRSDISQFYTIPKGISTQLSFYGCASVYSSSSFTVSNGAMYQNGKKLKNVAIAGVGELSIGTKSKTTLLSPYYKGTYNLFYNFA